MFDINILFPLGIVSQCGATDGFLTTVTWKVSDYNPCPSRAGRGALTATTVSFGRPVNPMLIREGGRLQGVLGWRLNFRSVSGCAQENTKWQTLST